jgi:hypothetical protein
VTDEISMTETGEYTPLDGFDYTTREPIMQNDLNGVGPFILAGIEVQNLLILPSTLKTVPSN